jgi:acetyl esterase/lipase
MELTDSRFDLIQDLAYGPEHDRAHLLDILKPRASTKPIPAIVHFHGGAWMKFGKYLEDCVFLAEAGFCTVSVNYRYSQDAVFPAQIHDAKSAIRWVRANAEQFGIDPNQIGVWGISAGAHLAALLGVTSKVEKLEGTVGITQFSSEVQAVACICPPTNFRDPNWQDFSSLLGGFPSDLPELTRLASPALQVTSGAPPFLIVHGCNDQEVPVDHAQLLHQNLIAANVSSRLEVIENGDHYINETHRQQLQRLMLGFFRQELNHLESQ